MKIKSYFIIGFLILSSFAKAQCTEQFTESFNGSIPTLNGAWSQNTLTFGSTTYPNACASCPRTGNYYLYYDAYDDYIQTPIISNPGVFSFWYRRSSTSATHKFVVETSPDGSTWSTRGSYSGTMSTTYSQFTVDLGALSLTNVYVRVRDIRPTATGAKVWYLDDISWENFKIGQWSGSVNSNWASPQNWCGNVLPSITTDVVIPAGTPNSPVLSTPYGYSNNITINSGASLKIQGGTLQIKGAITAPAGSITADTGTIEMVGTTAQTISGTVFVSKTLGNLRISNPLGVSVSGADTFKIKSILDFGVSNSIFNTNNKLTLLSSSTGTATIADLTSDGVYTGNRVTGNATVEKYLATPYKAWNFLSAPTVGQTINQSWQEGNLALGNTKPEYGTILTSNLPNAVSSLGFDLASGSPSIKTYNSSANSWEGIASTNIQIANPKGYMIFVRGDRSVTAYNQLTRPTTLRTYGKLYTPIDNPPPVISVAVGEFASVGNPYASDINFYKLKRTGGVQDVYYIWDPLLTSSTTSAYGLGGYQTFVGDGLGNYTITPGGGSYVSGNTNIKSGLAFFIKSTGTSGTLSFVERAKTNRRLRGQGNNNEGHDEKVIVSLSVSNQGDPILLDGAFVEYGARYSNLIDGSDISKINGTSPETVSIIRSGGKFLAERRGFINNTDTIFLGLNQLRRQTYILKIAPENMGPLGSKAIIIDNFLGTSEYLNMDSTTVKSFTVTTDPASAAPDRFYIVFNRSRSQNLRSTSKSSVQPQKIEDDNSVSVFPNPIVNRMINLTIRGSQSGECKIDIIDMSGNKIYGGKIFKPTGEFRHSIKLNSFASGEYIIRTEISGSIKELKVISLK